MPRVFIRIRLRRPRNDSLGALSGRGVRGRCQRCAHHTGYCIVSLLIRHTVDEPPLIANIGGHLHEEDVGRNLMRPEQYT